MLQEAIQHLQKGELSAAEFKLRSILVQQPKHSEALHYLGVIAYQKKNYLEAKDYCLKALRSSVSAQTHTLLGILQAILEEKIEAIANFRQALALDPSLLDAQLNLGLLLLSTGQLAEAEQLLKQVQQTRPSLSQTYKNLAEIAFLNQDFEQAIQHYSELLKLSQSQQKSSNPLDDYLSYLAYCAAYSFLAGKHGKVRHLLELILKERPEYVFALELSQQIPKREILFT